MTSSKSPHPGILTTALVAGWALALWSVSALTSELDAPATPSFGELFAISDVELAEYRGRDGNTNITVQTNQQLDAQVSNSSFQAGQINSGAVTFGEHALDNFSGVGQFTIVTGNNNAVNSALGVTFNLH